MNPIQRFNLALRVLRQLGPGQAGQYAIYQLGLRSGYLRWRTDRATKRALSPGDAFTFTLFLELPEQEKLCAVLADRLAELLAEADEVAAGRARLFGAGPVALRLGGAPQQEHWTAWERGAVRSGEDIKFIWEPGRFGWAYTLARAYHASKEERYPQAFWAHTEAFLAANPPNRGPHWSSAQEVALRAIALAFALHVFRPSPASTPERMERLGRALAALAARIPPTLAYARAQNNNHLLSEAAGLLTAGLALRDHPQAAGWRSLGWRWLNRALQAQIDADGAYVQHSANYHRLALQLVLWAGALARPAGLPFPEATTVRLAAATRWLLALVDRQAGAVPNLGPNDGALVQPLATAPFGDYRPVLQAATQAFLRERAFPAGPWDEMSLWYLGDEHAGSDRAVAVPTPAARPHILRDPAGSSWAYLRVARFRSRPGHADQLHLDLWWRGWNIAQDAGTYLYNGAPPWDNALVVAAVHNTVTVNGRDPMRRAGRFLWLDWAQARFEAHQRGGAGASARLAASHNGYKRLGVIYRREVTCFTGGRWLVVDRLEKTGRRAAAELTARLHWLLPDWPFEPQADAGSLALRLQSPDGKIMLRIAAAGGAVRPQIVRAGELLLGSGTAVPAWGWAAPTYGVKIPALSIGVSTTGPLPLELTSEWTLP